MKRIKWLVSENFCMQDFIFETENMNQGCPKTQVCKRKFLKTGRLLFLVIFACSNFCYYLLRVMNVVKTHIGLADFSCFVFFFRKNLFTLNFDFLQFDLWFFFKFSAFLLLKGRQTPLSNSKIVKVTKSVIYFQVWKWKLIIIYPSEIKVLPIDPVFSNWVNFYKKVSIINCYTASKSFTAI